MLYNTLLKVAEHGNQIKAIITSGAAREYSKKEADFKKIAKKLGTPYFFTDSLGKSEITRVLKGVDLGLSMNWVSIISQRQIDLFKIGILNAHFGDLPRYRGNATPNWAMINGEKEIVMSIHLMEGGRLDCGRVIIQAQMPVSEDTYIGDVYRWAEKIIPGQFLKAITLLKENPNYSLKYADINDRNSFRCYPRTPEDSLIDWSRSAEDIHRLIRASSKPFAGAYSYINSKKITIWKAQLLENKEKYLALPGQITTLNPTSFTVITGEGELRVTDYEPKGLMKSIRQRFDQMHRKNK
jgi:methionyl-tRNA formyltransferase